jgi:hypothetical protein
MAPFHIFKKGAGLESKIAFLLNIFLIFIKLPYQF